MSNIDVKTYHVLYVQSRESMRSMKRLTSVRQAQNLETWGCG